MLVHRLLFEKRYAEWVKKVANNAKLQREIPPPKSKLCVVISPLLSLMADQSEKVMQTGKLRAVSLTAARERQMEKEFSTPNASIDILFLSPERFTSSLSLRRLFAQNMDRIAVLCVDEVHCVSKWAHDFRPVFMYVSRVLSDTVLEKSEQQEKRVVPFLCLTATASSSVIEDITKSFNVQKTVFAADMLRRNLRLEAVDISKTGDANLSLLTKELHEGIAQAVVELPKPMIVYVETRTEADDICKLLMNRQGLSAKPGDSSNASHVFQRANYTRGTTEEMTTEKLTVSCYHAGLSTSTRNRTQRSFLKDEVDVLVATVAFGLGIDKANIRSVVHGFTPASLDEYIQEVGRAGRDGKESICRLLYNPHSFYHMRTRIWSSVLSPEEVSNILQKILESVVSSAGEPFTFVSPSHLSNELSIHEEAIETVLFLLVTDTTLREEIGVLIDSVQGTCASKFKVRVAKKDGDEKSAPKKNKKKREREDEMGVGSLLLQLDVTDPVLKYCGSHCVIPNTVIAANALHMPLLDFHRRLEELSNEGLIQLRPSSYDFLVLVGPAFLQKDNADIKAKVFNHICHLLRERTTAQEASLRSTFGVLASPNPEEIQSLLKGDHKKGCVWSPPVAGRKKMEAVQLVADFLEKNRNNLSSKWDAIRCLLGITPRSQIKYGKFAGQLPLTQSWYVRSPYFGTLKEFDMDWLSTVIEAHSIDYSHPAS
ncbi:DEAD/DEAH box helicase/Helicase conserved C-terminal domain containing protein, putative [Angomonas deanei]|uniref:DNA 3'-5' helicase n=1 Tax=Angomonas deanei TaxID=59799 RepID=A0A7G2CG96_9TRYP|nr:DEAD/DEAH box helicase/Helicase conserved C-terminal domain containing protein, putative [Angomonas deanei]